MRIFKQSTTFLRQFTNITLSAQGSKCQMSIYDLKRRNRIYNVQFNFWKNVTIKKDEELDDVLEYLSLEKVKYAKRGRGIN